MWRVEKDFQILHIILLFFCCIRICAAQTGSIAADPSQLVINPSQLGSTSISWATTGLPTAQVYVSHPGGSETLMSESPSGTASVSWIELGRPYIFNLYAGTSHNQLLASVTVNTNAPAVGVVIPDLVDDFISPNWRSSQENAVRLRMGYKAIADAYHEGAQNITIMLPGYFPENPYQLSAGYNDLALWQQNPDAYWQKMDVLIDDIVSKNLSIVVHGWSELQMFPTLAGETTRDIVTNPASKSYALYTQYWGQFLARYKNVSNIIMYSAPNEMNLAADLDMVARCKQANAGSDQAAVCSSAGNYSTDEMNTFSSRIVAFFHAANPEVKVASDMGLPPTYAEHLRARPEWSQGGADWTADTKAQLISNFQIINTPYDIYDAHIYNGSRTADIGFSGFSRFGYGANDAYSVDLLQVFAPAASSMGKPFYVTELGDTYIGGLESRQFTKNFISKLTSYGVSGASIWGYEFYQFNTYAYQQDGAGYYDLEPGLHDDLFNLIQSVNSQAGQAIYQANPSDETPPNIIISYPFDGSHFSGNVMVNTLASANSQNSQSSKLQRVEYYVDNVLNTTLYHQPFELLVQGGGLALGTHTVKAIAYDSAGNSASDSISLIRDSSSGSLPGSDIPSAGGAASENPMSMQYGGWSGNAVWLVGLGLTPFDSIVTRKMSDWSVLHTYLPQDLILSTTGSVTLNLASPEEISERQTNGLVFTVSRMPYWAYWDSISISANGDTICTTAYSCNYP